MIRTVSAIVGNTLVVRKSALPNARRSLVTNRALVLAGQALHVSTQPTQTGVATPPIYTVPGANGSVRGLMLTPVNGTLTAYNLTFSSISSFDEWDALFVYGAQTTNPQIPAGAFLIIGHCVWSWLLAFAAGCFAAFACRPRASAT